MPNPRPTGLVNRVLIVEDDHLLAEMMAEVLTFENHLPEIAGNGLEALDKLRTGDYEAVICDLMLPGLDGEQLYIKATKEFPYLTEKFLFITGQASSRTGLTDFVNHTGNALLVKPFEVEQLRTALNELLAR